MLLLAYVLLNGKGVMPLIRLSKMVWILLIAGSLVVLFSYMQDFATYVLDYKQSLPSTELSRDQLLLTLSSRFMPRNFDWLLFCTGVGMHLAAVFLVFIGKRKGIGVH
jgi:hypothetical protein